MTAAGPDVIDVGRGNPDVPPPAHVVEALVESARERTAAVHGYPPFVGLKAAKRAIAERYAGVYGVELDPEREVAFLPGTTTALVELALVLAQRGDRILRRIPAIPTTTPPSRWPAPSGSRSPSPRTAGRTRWCPARARRRRLPQLPGEPRRRRGPARSVRRGDRVAHETEAAIVHDFAYGDLVFDGRRPESFLAVVGAREVGVEMFSLSKSYGMAGWRLGFVVGNTDIVGRLTWSRSTRARGSSFRCSAPRSQP